MSIFFTILTLASCLILTACSDEDEKARLLEGIVKRSTLNDSLKKEIIQSEIDKAALEAISDSLSKFGDILLENNNQLSEELNKTKQEADEYRRNNEHLQEEVSQLQVEIGQLQEDKRTSEQEIRRLSVAIDSISVDRDRLIGVNQDLKNKLRAYTEIMSTVRRFEK